MIGLLRAELLRLRSRRAIQVLVIGLAVLLLLIVISLFINSSGNPPNEETLEAARRQYEEVLRQCEGPEIDCGPEFTEDLQVEDFYEDPRFILGKDVEVPLLVYAVFATLISFMVGATSMGSEGHHNTLGHLLLWEPRRGRVLLAKAAAAAVATALMALALLCLLFAGMWVVAATRGVTNAPSGFWGETAATIGRASLLAGLAGLLGIAVTSLLRSTAAAVGMGLAYLAALERFLAAFRPEWRPWMAGDLASAVLTGENRLIVGERLVELPGGGFEHVPIEVVIGAGRGLLVLGAYLAVLLAIAILEFRRRDVT
ncbi:MAG: hypothetical protein WD770_05985 [Actinomycetota bacterium]